MAAQPTLTRILPAGAAWLAAGKSVGGASARGGPGALAAERRLCAALRNAREVQERERRDALRRAKEGASLSGAAMTDESVVGGGGGESTTSAVVAEQAAVDYAKAAAAAARASELAAAASASSSASAARQGAEASASAPSTAQQFEREWGALQRCGGAVEAQRAWLSQLPASSYAHVFQESLSEATLVSLLGAVHAILSECVEAGASEAAGAVSVAVCSRAGEHAPLQHAPLLLDEPQKKRERAACRVG